MLLDRDDPPERVARGLAAGSFAAAFPLPGLQVVLSLFFAWAVRGNKAVAIFPQFLVNAVTLGPLIYLQLKMGAWFWPGSAMQVDRSLEILRDAGARWSWTELRGSISALGRAAALLGVDALGPLGIGVLITGFLAATITYPVALVVLTLFRSRRLQRRAQMGVGMRPARGELTLRPMSAEEAGWTEQQMLQSYALRPETYVRADCVRLLVDGSQAYPEMLEAIVSAQASVDLETYILKSDKTGRRFAAALIAAARRGVKVRLLYDGVGGMGLPQEYVDMLLKGNVDVRVYRPFSTLWRLGLGSMNRRDHRKIMIVDEYSSFTGGLNISDEYASRDEGGEGWRDTHVRIDGVETARQHTDIFDETWPNADVFALPFSHQAAPAAVALRPATRASRRQDRIKAASQRLHRAEGHAKAVLQQESATEPEPLHSNGLPRYAASCNKVLVQTLSNREFLQRVRVRRIYLNAIRNARRYILLENAYFIPDRQIRRALADAVKRGVSVGVVVAMYSDIRVVALASRHLYADLLQSGVRLFEYPVTMMHCKVAVIDDCCSVVSSYNLDHRSLLHNLEAGALILDRTFAIALREQVQRDIGRCREVTRDFHSLRLWNEALIEFIAYQCRYWL